MVRERRCARLCMSLPAQPSMSRNNQFVGDIGCEKLPVEICGAGCVFEEGEEVCHEKVLTSLVDVPEEVCDLNPQKTCRLTTKLVPRLKPTHSPKTLHTRWCLDPTPAAPGESYEENDALGSPIGRR